MNFEINESETNEFSFPLGYLCGPNSFLSQFAVVSI